MEGIKAAMIGKCQSSIAREGDISRFKGSVLYAISVKLKTENFSSQICTFAKANNYTITPSTYS